METMIFTDDAYGDYKRTVAQKPAETGGVLIGKPSDPFKVLKFDFCPPDKNLDGSYVQSATRFGIDADYINWRIENDWGPQGLYVLGFLHSHPGRMSTLSGGNMNGVAGDIPLLTACLEATEMKAAGIHQLLAPITTFRADGSDEIHGWMLRRGSRVPEKINIVVEEDVRPSRIENPPHSQNKIADTIDDLVLRRRGLLQNPALTFGDRRVARQLYAKAMAAIPLVQSESIGGESS